MRIWFDYQDEDDQNVIADVDVCPRIGEKVGVRQPDGMEGTEAFALDYVVDVRHYALHNEVHVMTSSDP